MNERKMMNLLKKQEKRALEWLYEQYSPFIYGTIRRIGKTDEVVEQLLVQTFMKAWSEAKTIDFSSDETKLQQSILALRARLKINQVLMPR